MWEIQAYIVILFYSVCTYHTSSSCSPPPSSTSPRDMFSGSTPVWNFSKVPTNMLSWNSSVEKSVTGGDIVLELTPSKRRFMVSRLHVNRLPYFSTLFNWLEQSKPDAARSQAVPVRLERVGEGGNLKTIFTLSEDQEDLFEIFIRIMHLTSADELWKELDRLSETGHLLPLLQFANRYHHIELVHMIRLELASIILRPTTPLDTVFEILAQFDLVKGVDNPDGAWDTQKEEHLMAHPVVIASMHRLRCSPIAELQQHASTISSTPSLLLMRLIAFPGEIDAVCSFMPSWQTITKKRVFADAALTREKRLLRGNSSNHQHEINWDSLLSEWAKESYYDSERLAKRIALIWQRRSPISIACLQILSHPRDTFRRTQSDENRSISKYRKNRQQQQYQQNRQDCTSLTQSTEFSDPMCVEGLAEDETYHHQQQQQQQQLMRSRSQSAPQIQPEATLRQHAIFCETVLSFPDRMAPGVGRAMSSSIVTALQNPHRDNNNKQGVDFLEFFLQAERLMNDQNQSIVGWEYKLCVRWKPTETYKGVSSTPRVNLIVNASLWANQSNMTALPESREVCIEDRVLAYEPVSLGRIGATQTVSLAHSVPILIEGVTLV